MTWSRERPYFFLRPSRIFFESSCRIPTRSVVISTALFPDSSSKTKAFAQMGCKVPSEGRFLAAYPAIHIDSPGVMSALATPAFQVPRFDCALAGTATKWRDIKIENKIICLKSFIGILVEGFSRYFLKGWRHVNQLA